MKDHGNLELERMAAWLIGSAFIAAGALMVGYFLGSRSGERKSHLAKDMRIAAQQQRITRLEKTLSGTPGASRASPTTETESSNP